MTPTWFDVDQQGLANIALRRGAAFIPAAFGFSVGGAK